MRLRVQAGSLVFGGQLRDRFIIAPDGFVGWDDSTDTKRNTVARAQAHGDFSVRGFRVSRTVTISGTCVADSEQQLAQYGAQLTGLFADGNIGSVTIEHSGKTLWAPCYLDGKTEFVMLAPFGEAAAFKIQFYFPDPRRYGSTLSFAAGVASYHYGNFAAAPVHTVTGSAASGYTINGPTGKMFTVTAPLVTGHPHTIDMATGFLTVDGAIVVGGVSQGDTWTIAGGAQVTHALTVPTGTAVLSSAVTDTYS